MIKFKLDPQSGHVDSYLDVLFNIEFEPAEKVEIRIFNDSIRYQLDLLGISNGYIHNENTAIIKSGNSVEGYINIFNKDKMNKGLRSFVGVDIRCEVIRYKDNNIISNEEDSLTFYNHSQSLDSNIVPFDLIITNTVIDVKNDLPFTFNIVCDQESKYELCVRSEDGYSECTFEIITKPGTITIDLPVAILWHDLKIFQSMPSKKFDIYWVKFEGIDHLKFMNRKYIKIDNTRLSFNETNMMPHKTERVGPTGQFLPDYFVLSHRYYVHTHKRWSEYGGYIDGYSARKLRNLTMLWHESQNMELVNQQIVGLFNKEEKTPSSEIKQALWHQHRSNVQKTIKSHRGSIKNVLSSYKTIYTKKSIEAMSTDLDFVPKSTSSPASKHQSTKSNGCGCSRKKNG